MNTDMEDKKIAERTIEDGLYYLRSEERTSPDKRNKWRKKIKNEMFFLKQEHPDSYILQEDISDISLELEK